MQMLCKVTNVSSDVRCPVCGQGFLVYWTRIAAHDRLRERDRLTSGLRGQHTGSTTAAEAHPAAFYLGDGAPAATQDDPALFAAPGLLGVYS